MTVAQSLDLALHSGSWLAIPLAFVGGLVMALNPCCVAMYPAAAATCSVEASDGPRRLAWRSASAFLLGTAAATTALGIAAALAGRTLAGLTGTFRYLTAAVPLVMGLHTLRWLQIPLPRAIRLPNAPHVTGAFLTGLLLALVTGPCGTPVLAAVLSVAAWQGSAAYGAALLFAYGIGSGLPVLAVGLGAGEASRWVGKFAHPGRIQTFSGAMLLALGLWLLWSA